MRGRKPKPAELREREGDPGKRGALEPFRTAPFDTTVQPPAPLQVDAQAMWDELNPMLARAGILDPADGAALYAMCVQWGRAQQAGKVLRQEGLFAPGSMGQTVEHPAVATERNAHAMYIRFAEQFGLTPVARARVAAALKARISETELDEVLNASPQVIEVDDVFADVEDAVEVEGVEDEALLDFNAPEE